MKETTDFKGIKYKSLRSMCKAYNISPCTYIERIKRGYSVEEALTNPIIHIKKSITDFNGNVFESVTSMCEHYNISINTYRARLSRGLTLKETLTIPVGFKYRKVCDFKGQKFKSISEMCKHYNIPRKNYIYRVYRGWTQKDALTIPIGKKPKIDKELTELVKQTYDIYSEEFQNRKNLFVEIKNPYTGEMIKVITDHKGFVYTNKTSLLSAYKVYYKKFDRLLSEKGLKEALFKPIVKDHLGNVYKSRSDMYRAYGIRKQTAEFRLERGWTLEQTLTTPVNQKPKKVPDYTINTEESDTNE